MSKSAYLIQPMSEAAGAGDWLKVDDIAARLPKELDAGLVVDLLGLLRDDPVGREVLFGLVHAAESADESVYICGLLKALPGLVDRSEKWSRLVVIRVLNSTSSLDCLLKALPQAPADQREAVAVLVHTIEQEAKPRFADALLRLHETLS